MKIGDYVRTKLGDISKIVFIHKEGLFIELADEVLRNDETKSYMLFNDENDVKKISPNIIDLIEVGDYVNGYEVTSKDQFLGFGNHDWYMTNDEIKSIVTKEQFESIKHEVK